MESQAPPHQPAVLIGRPFRYNMEVLQLHERTRLPFFWLALIPVILTIVAFWFGHLYREDVALVTHTFEARAAARDIIVLMLNAETGQRGYLLTGDGPASK